MAEPKSSRNKAAEAARSGGNGSNTNNPINHSSPGYSGNCKEHNSEHGDTKGSRSLSDHHGDN